MIRGRPGKIPRHKGIERHPDGLADLFQLHQIKATQSPLVVADARLRGIEPLGQLCLGQPRLMPDLAEQGHQAELACRVDALLHDRLCRLARLNLKIRY